MSRLSGYKPNGVLTIEELAKFLEGFPRVGSGFNPDNTEVWIATNKHESLPVIGIELLNHRIDTAGWEWADIIFITAVSND